MSTPTANQLRKEADIKREVREWLAKGIYCKEYIYKQVAWKFYLEPETIMCIHWGAYDRRRDLEHEREAMDGAPPKKRRAKRRKPRASKHYPR